MRRRRREFFFDLFSLENLPSGKSANSVNDALTCFKIARQDPWIDLACLKNPPSGRCATNGKRFRQARRSSSQYAVLPLFVRYVLTGDLIDANTAQCMVNSVSFLSTFPEVPPCARSNYCIPATTRLSVMSLFYFGFRCTPHVEG